MSTLTSVTISRHAWITLGILSSTLLVVFFSETMLLPAIPEIMKDFRIPYGTAAWIFSSYLIVAAVMTPIAGKMSDLYGKKKILLMLLTLYVAGITAGGFAHNITFLLMSRIIQGIGLAAVPAAFSLLRDTFPPAKLAIAVGVFGSAYSAGSVVGLLAGATIIQMFGWHSTFLSIVPFAAAVTVMIAKFVQENKAQIAAQGNTQQSTGKKKQHTSPTIDIKGALALSITVISFLIALTLVQSGINPKTLSQIEIAFIASAISLAIFVLIERRVPSPLVDMRLLKDKTLMPSYIIAIATGITMFMAYPAIVQLVRNPVPLGFGGSAVDAANVQLPFMIMFLVFSSITPLIINRIGKLNPIIIGTIVSLIGSVGLLVFHSTKPAVSINLAIIASGLSMTITATWNVIVSSSPKSFVGISVGVGALLLFIGMSIGPALTGVYMENHQTIKGVQGSYPSLGSYNLVYLTSGLLSAVSLGFVLLLRRRVAQKTIEV
ncbi:MAG TPA: MFS transporter [Nitrososphaeraceae archaeon]